MKLLTTPGITLLDCARLVIARHQFMMIKPVNASLTLFACRDDDAREFDLYREEDDGPKPKRRQSRKGWIVLDAFTSGAVVAVCDAINPLNQAKLLSLPMPKALTVIWKFVR